MRRSNGSSDATACYKILLVAMWDRMPAAKVFMHVAVRTMHDGPNETTKIFRPAQLAPEEQALSARTPLLTLIGCCLHDGFT
jgi:transcription elongation GreA/GreB family factor